ncbi:MAG TPA: hypothetical protein VFT05_18130 [Burkholderiaceae bacterium]|nr:hypothetical protein [Burkholderiaceae bacterium]
MKFRSASALLARLLIWPLVGMALLYLILLLINRHDQPASPAAQRLEDASRARVPVAESDNGYLYSEGFGHIRENDSVRLKQGEGQAFKTLRDGCKSMDRACETLLASSEKALRSALDADPWTLARYRDLILRGAWQGPMPIDVKHGAPRLVPAAVGQQLLMMDAWNRARAGDAAAVGVALSQDHRFWRMVLSTSDDLMGKSYARVALRRNLLWGNIVLAQLPRGRQEAAVPAQWRQPFTLQERSLMATMVGEYQFLKTVLDDMAGEAAVHESPLVWPVWSITAPLLQRQDSMNTWAARNLPRIAALDVGYRDYPAALARLRALEKSASSDWSLEIAYNPVGKTLMSEVPEWSSYSARLADLEGIRLATLLAAELRSVGVALHKVPDYVAAAPLRNPFDGKPFGWDARTRSLIFTGLEPGPRGRSELAY